MNLRPLTLLLSLCLPLPAQFVVGTGSPINPGCVNRALAVGAGDFHLSGHVDLAITCDASGNPGSARVFPGNGTGTFGAASTTAAGVFPASLVVADFNGDGKLDLAVVNQSDKTVDVYQGDGAGGFTLQATLGQGQGIGQNPVYVTTGYIGFSGLPDLVVVSQSDATVTVLLNNGSFSFFPNFILSTSGTNPASVAVADFSGSGLQDLAVVNNGSGTVDIFQNFGEGGFSSPIPYAAGGSPTSVVTGDFNGDGHLDLAVTNGAGGTTVSVLLGDGLGGFSAATSFSGAGTSPTSIVTGDFNNDGKLDLAMADNFATGATVAVLLGNGSGGFAAAPGSPYTIAGQQATSLVAGDFNGDHRLDLAITTTSGINVLLNTELRGIPPALTFTGGSDPNAPAPLGVTETISALAGATATFTASPTQTWLGVVPTTGSTSAPVNLTVTASPTGLAAGTHLAAINVTAPNHFAASIPVTLNLIAPSGILLPAAGSPFALAGQGPQMIVSGDFDNDGIPDLAIADQTTDDITIFKGNGSGGFTQFASSPLLFDNNSGPLAMAVGDFNGDGNLDLAFTDGSDPVVFILLGDGTDNFFPAGSFPCGPNPASLTVADFNGDGFLDLAFSNTTLLLGDGNGNFAPAPAVGLQTGTTYAFFVANGDFNGDGLPDIAVVDEVAKTLSISLNNGAGGFTAAAGSPYATGSAPTGVAVGDFNRDGKLDIVVANRGAATLSVFLGSGTGSFSQATGSPYSVDSAATVLVTDINGDGYPDIVAVGPSGTASILLGNGAGTFAHSPGGSVLAGFGPYAVVAGDFNNDGRQDLAFSDNSGNNVTVMLGASASTQNTLSTTAPVTVAAGTQIPLTALVADTGAGFNIPTGTVIFKDGTTTVSTMSLSSGTANYSSAYPVGTHVFSALYNGDLRSLTSSSNTVTANVIPGPPASIAVSAGNAQTATVQTAFATALQAVVMDAFGNPVPSATVTFTAPLSGASGTFSGGSTNVMAATNASGIATAPVFTANSIGGSYAVTATVTGARTAAVFTLTNTGGSIASNPASVTFTVTQPATTLSASQTLSLTSSGATPFTVTVNTASWLSATPGSGTTPATVVVSLLPAALQLAPGAYNASITLQSGTNQTVVPVSLTVLAPFGPLPAGGVSFVYVSSSPTPPPPQTFILSSSNRPLPFSISVPFSAPWLMVTPASGTTAATVTVSVNPVNLAPGSYSAAVSISSPFASNGPLTLPVTVQVQAVTTASPTSLTFAASVGQNPSAPQSVSIGGASGVSFAAQTSASWIVVSPTSGVTPASLSVKVDPTGLAAGSYFGSIAISGVGAASLSIPVSVTIQPALTVVTGSGNGPVFLMPTAMPGVFAADTSLVTNTTGSTFTATVSGQGLTITPSSGTLPAVLHTSVDASNFAPGTYQGAITLNIPDANPPTRTLTVSFTVNPPQPPQVMTQAPELTFSVPSTAPQASRQALASNLGSGSINFTSSADQPWVQVSPLTGATTALGAAPITINLNLSGFKPGTYHAGVTVASATNSVTIPVNVSVSALPTGIALSQTGLTFGAVAGGSSPPPQSFQVLDTGTVPFGFQVSTSTTSGGPNWLTATPAVGSTDTAPAVQVAVNTTGLAAGTYYGQVQILSAPNPQQSVTVVLNVAPTGTLIRPSVAPSGLIFTSVAKGSNPAAQTIAIQNPTTSSIQFVTTPIYSGGVNFFSYDPPSGQIAPGQTQTITVTATPVTITRSLAAGVYQAQLNLGFVGYDAISPIAVLLVVAPQASSAVGHAQQSPRAAGCTPAKLLPVFTMLGSNFSVSAGFPAAIQVQVVDDCANTITTGSVVTTFSSGDPPLSLKSLGNGGWAATWVPRNAAPNTVITGSAAMNVSSALTIKGSVQIMGNAQTNVQTPIVASGGVVNAASFAKSSPIPPGALVTIFGSNLADQQSAASVLPLPNQLGTTSVTIDGLGVPLLFAGSGQVNAVVPFALLQNVTHLLVVTKGNAISVPEPITIATAQPAVFTVDGSGKGQGVVLGFLSGGGQVLADSANPVSAGGYIVMYATGLGAVTPPVADGIAGPSGPLSKVAGQISLTIGGVDATITYAGLAPGFASLYQVNAIVPAVAPGNSVPLVITVEGQASPPVTIAVK